MISTIALFFVTFLTWGASNRVVLPDAGRATGVTSPTAERAAGSKYLRFRALLNASGPARQWKWLALLALVIVIGGMAARMLTSSIVFPEAGVKLDVSIAGPSVRIAWEPAQKPFRSATGAVLEVRDGDSAPLLIPISRDRLNDGATYYTPQSDKIDVRMKLLAGRQLVTQSKLYLIVNPSRESVDVAAPANLPSPAPEPAALAPATVPPEAPEPAASTLMPPSSETVPIPKEDSPARIRVVVRSFNPPSKHLASTADNHPQAQLPELPQVHTAQTPSLLTLPSSSFAGVRPPPAPAAPPAAAAVPVATEPRSGRLIWTGELSKNSLLALSQSGASIGFLKGRLPGFPIKVSVQPAELVSGGMAIFSNDQSKSGATETPSARNGWNVVVYRWDPKRNSDLSVIERPGPSNNWQHLVLRTGSRGLSVLVVDWQRDGAR